MYLSSTKIVLFYYLSYLQINNSTYHASFNHSMKAYLMRGGEYETNAIDVIEFPQTDIYYRESVEKGCGESVDYITYYSTMKHNVNINWGGSSRSVLYLDNEILSIDSNGYLSRIMDKGIHNIELFIGDCLDPKDLQRGRFLTMWMYNVSSKIKPIYNLGSLYNIDGINNKGYAYI